MMFASAMWQAPAKVSDLPALFEQMAEASLAEALVREHAQRVRDAKILPFPLLDRVKAGGRDVG